MLWSTYKVHQNAAHKTGHKYRTDLITNEGTFYCKHLRTLAPARHRIHFHERTESNGSAKELGKTISFSHRKFLSQKGQSLAANTKGKQYMESMCDRLLSASRTDASVQSP